MIDDLKEVYSETFYLFMEKQYGKINREEIKQSLDILFDYTEERSIDLFSFSLEDADSFLLWYQTEEQDREVYDRLTRVMIDFYNFLVLLSQTEINPFQRIREIKIKQVLKKIKERFPDKKLFNPDTGEEL